MQDLLDHCARMDEPPTLPVLGALLRDVEVSDSQIEMLRRTDVDRPYGREVLLATDHVEGMLASWTPGSWCNPHDHGGSVGGVRVLRGRARHRVFRIQDGALELVREEQVEAGGVMRCGPTLVHAMRCDDADQGLVTLHLYGGPIDHMVVYDTGRNATLVVDGGCGAWVPDDAPELIRERYEGIVRPNV